MSNRSRLIALTIIMTVVVLAVLGVSMRFLYHAALNGQKARLSELVKNEARLIEAITRQEFAEHGSRAMDVINQTVLEQVRDAQANYVGLGQSGEFMLGRREEASILFEFRSRHATSTASAYPAVPWDSNLGEPMRKALSGQSGCAIAADYRGVLVLAAYEPVADSNWGVVAKIDLAEIRAPFIRAITVTGSCAVLLILGGAILFVTITRPIARHIEQTEQNFAALFQSMNEGVALHEIVYGPDGQAVNYRIVDVNSRFQEITGVRRENVIGRLATDAYGTPDAPFLSDYAAVAATRERREFETYFPPMGRYFLISATSFRKGTFATIFTDITQRKRDELELSRANRELQQKNAEMEQFVYTVSHDLKSPLVTIQGYAGHLRQNARGEQEIRFTDYILSAAIRMRQLIDDLLDLSRIGRIVQPAETIDIAELVKDIVQQAAVEIEQRGITITVQEPMPAIQADRRRLTQIFENLSLNALRHGGGSAAPAIVVGAETSDHEIRYFVRDNGPGIAPEYHKKIFDIFHRLDPRTEGTGIGLAIVKRAIEIHGGRVWVESGTGQGATFWVAFPSMVAAKVQPVSV